MCFVVTKFTKTKTEAAAQLNCFAISNCKRLQTADPMLVTTQLLDCKALRLLRAFSLVVCLLYACSLCLLSMAELYGRALCPPCYVGCRSAGRSTGRSVGRAVPRSACVRREKKSGRAADFRGSRCVYQSAQYSRDIRQSTLERPHTHSLPERGVERKSSPPDERHTRRALPKKIHTVGTHRPHTEFGSLAPHHASTT